MPPIRRAPASAAPVTHNQYELGSWMIDQAHPETTVVFFEPTGVAAIYMAIYRVINPDEVDVVVETARGNSILLRAGTSLDVSSVVVKIKAAGALVKGQRVRGQYQHICCSLASSSMAVHSGVTGGGGMPGAERSG